MSTSLVLTISAHDRPGIISRLSNTITESGGNWLESRMARLAGQFVGIVCIECTKGKESDIRENLEKLHAEGIHVHVLGPGDLSDYPFTRHMRIDIFGNDRPGIVSQLAKVISQAGANIEEINTSIESAAMSGQSIFHVCGTICLPDSCDDETIITAIESLSDDLTIEAEAL
jgi:glycine cleavage system regulatory protein